MPSRQSSLSSFFVIEKCILMYKGLNESSSSNSNITQFEREKSSPRSNASLPVNYRKSRCLKITIKVSLNIASEASYLRLQFQWTNAKNGAFWRGFAKLKLTVKKCYQTGQFDQDKNWWKMPNLKNSNETFLVILRQCYQTGYF